MPWIQRLSALVLGTALVLGLGLGPASADPVELTVSVRTANATTLFPLHYALQGGGGSASASTAAGNDGTTAVSMTLDVEAPAGATLRTPYGDFGIDIASDGTLSPASGAPLSISGTQITIENDVDFPDFGIRMLQATTLDTIHISMRTSAPTWYVNTPVDGGTKTLAGATADEPLEWPLLGLVPGTRIQVLTNLGAFFFFEVTDTGGIDTSPIDNDVLLPITRFMTAPETLIIQNGYDLADFALRVARPTTLAEVRYRLVTSNLPGSFFPGPDDLEGPPAIEGLKFQPGASAHVDEVAFPLLGLAANQAIRIDSNFGRVGYRVQSDGSLEADSESPGLEWDEDTLVVQNLLDFPDFRVRFVNPCSATRVRAHMAHYNTGGLGGSIAFRNDEEDAEDPIYRWMEGDAADEGVGIPLLGLAPGMIITANTSIGSSAVFIEADGDMVYAGVYSLGEVEDVDGHAELVLENPLSVRCRVYGEAAAPQDVWTSVSFYYGYSPIDPGPFQDTYKEVDAADWPTGAQFLIEGVSGATGLGATSIHGPANPFGVRFNLNPDGTATFWAPAIQLTPWVGGIEIDADKDGTLDDWHYVEIAPLNEAPTATLDTDNFTIASSEQDGATIGAEVGDEDGDTLSCSWYVDDVLVQGPEAPSDAACALDLGDLDALGVGEHTIRLEVSDGELAAMPEVVLTVANSPPEVVAEGGGVYELDEDSDVTLGGTVADYDGDEVAWSWHDAEGAALASGTVETTEEGAPVALPTLDVETLSLGVGTHLLVLSVEDESNEPVSATAIVEVSDTVAPTLAPSASRSLLWPPNHQLVAITVDANALDASGGSLSYEVEVESNEPPEFDDDGGLVPDHEIVSVDEDTGEISLKLRAERSGKGDGRVYTIYVTVTDESGNASTATFEVKAPHDKRSN